MWRVSVDSVEKCLEEAPLKKGTDSAKLHQRLFTTLKTLRDFYHCGGDGLQDRELDSDTFMVWNENLMMKKSLGRQFEHVERKLVLSDSMFRLDHLILY